jgi:hypothetical protein
MGLGYWVLMSITVTPIPTLIEFATPSITIGATAAAGDALTAIRSNSTIAGVALVATTVNDSIARFNGTAGQLQGYTSLSPTISDDGIISITSGALKWPATAVASADNNTLDDYQQGIFTPILKDTGGNPCGSSVASGAYTRIGNTVFITFKLTINDLTGVTTSSAAQLHGLPYVAVNESDMAGAVFCYYGTSLNLSATGAYVTGNPEHNAQFINMREWSAAEGVASALTIAEVSSDGVMNCAGQYRV